MKRIVFGVLAIAAFALGAVFIADPAMAANVVQCIAGSPELGASVLVLANAGAVDMTKLLEAIEGGNKAFEEFKKINDQRIKLIEEGKGGAGDLEAKMKKAFDDMAEQKKTIENIEAKLKRPHLGVDGKAVDQAAEEHRKAFVNFVKKNTSYDEGQHFYQEGVSVKSLAALTGSDGGYAVPKVIDGMIEQVAVNVSPIRKIAQVVQISTQDYHKLVDTRGTSSGWVGETATRTSTNTPTLADINPPMGELYAFPQATQVMLDDVFFNAEAWLADSVGTEFARAEGAAFVSGTGVAQPKGFTQYTTVATADATRTFGQLEYVGTGSSGAFRTLSSTVNPADDLFNVVSKLKAAYRPGACWVLNKKSLFAIMAFKDYQGRYVFSPAAAPGMSDSILGYPVVEAEDMPDYTTTSALAVAFGNFKRGYIIVDRVGTRVIRDPFSNKPYVGFYTTKRVGGAVLNSECIKFIKMA